MKIKFLTNILNSENVTNIDREDAIEANKTLSSQKKYNPIIYDANSNPIYIKNMYKGKSAFLILGGPSFLNILHGDSDDHGRYVDMLSHPGFVTMSVNNSIRSFRSDLWVNVDTPDRFIRSAWIDPKIMKFAPFERINSRIFNTDTMNFMDVSVKECPNTWFYKRNSHFNPKTFLDENSFNWGNSKQSGGKRSVMLVAIKLLYYLGIRKIYLLGCDFQMSSNYTYHFKQSRHKSSVTGNTKTYEELCKRFELLLPHFEEHDLKIYNCNLDSKLKIFPFITFENAWSSCLEDFDVDINNENTEGLYDREFKIKMTKKGKDLFKLY